MKIWFWLTIAFLALWILCGAITITNAISSSRIDSWLIRAKEAGNPAQVAEFLTEYKEALYASDRVEGRYTSMFRYPATKMTVYVRAIDGLIERAKALANQEATDTSYQMGLVNLEKDLGDIDTAAYRVWGATYPVIGILAYFGWVGVLISGFITVLLVIQK